MEEPGHGARISTLSLDSLTILLILLFSKINPFLTNVKHVHIPSVVLIVATKSKRKIHFWLEELWVCIHGV